MKRIEKKMKRNKKKILRKNFNLLFLNPLKFQKLSNKKKYKTHFI